MDIVNLKVADLKPYPENTKKHDETQIDNVAESIKEFGFVQPLVVDKDGVVIIGHCRLLAAKKLKLKEVPCYRAEELSEEQTRKLRIIDNKTNESPWDIEMLRFELPEVNFDNYNFDFAVDFEKEYFGGENGFEDEAEIEGDDDFLNGGIGDNFKNVEEKNERKHVCPNCGFEFEE